MKKLVCTLFLLLAPVSAQAQMQEASMAASRFYAAWMAQPHAGLPSAPARAQLQPLLSARLSQLIARAAAAEAKFRAANRFAPPLLEGDLFSSLLDGPSSFAVGACTGTATAQRCRIQFARPLDPRARGPARPATWGDDLLLVQEGGGWKVDDVDYRGGFVSGNTGLLSQTLGMVIQAAS